MAQTTKNLGQVAAIIFSTTQPSNTKILWYDETPGIPADQRVKYYNADTIQWRPIAQPPPESINTIDRQALNISARDSLLNKQDGENVYVEDASADANVTSGWAIYKWFASTTSWQLLVKQETVELDISGKEDTGVASSLVNALKGSVSVNNDTLEKIEDNLATKADTTDPRFTDQRVPTPASVDFTKLHSTVINDINNKENIGVAAGLVDGVKAGVSISNDTLEKIENNLALKAATTDPRFTDQRTPLPNSVTVDKIPLDTITEDRLSPDVRTKLNAVGGGSGIQLTYQENNGNVTVDNSKNNYFILADTSSNDNANVEYTFSAVDDNFFIKITNPKDRGVGSIIINSSPTILVDQSGNQVTEIVAGTSVELVKKTGENTLRVTYSEDSKVPILIDSSVTTTVIFTPSVHGDNFLIFDTTSADVSLEIPSGLPVRTGCLVFNDVGNNKILLSGNGAIFKDQQHNIANSINPSTGAGIVQFRTNDWRIISGGGGGEFVTPLSYLDGTPFSQNITTSTAQLVVKNNKNSTHWFVAVPTIGAVRPSTTQIKAGQNSSGVSVPVGRFGSFLGATDVLATANITGLSSNTGYTVYIYTENSDNAAEFLESNISFTTTSVTIAVRNPQVVLDESYDPQETGVDPPHIPNYVFSKTGSTILLVMETHRGGSTPTFRTDCQINGVSLTEILRYNDTSSFKHSIQVWGAVDVALPANGTYNINTIGGGNNSDESMFAVMIDGLDQILPGPLVLQGTASDAGQPDIRSTYNPSSDEAIVTFSTVVSDYIAFGFGDAQGNVIASFDSDQVLGGEYFNDNVAGRVSYTIGANSAPSLRVGTDASGRISIVGLVLRKS